MKVRLRKTKGSYSIEWSELLHLDETLLENIDDAVPDTELLAPYYDPITIKYAVATVMPFFECDQETRR